MPSIHRRTGMLIIAAMVAAVFFLSLPGTTVWRKVLQDAGHGPVFAVVGIVLALMRAPPVGESARSPTMYLRAFAIAVAIGVVTELIQHFQPGRIVSLIDVLHDAAGAAFGLALLAVVERRRPSPGLAPTSPAAAGDVKEPSPAQQRERVGAAGVRAFLIMIALAAFAILAWQPLQAARAYAARAAAFPTLADGEAQPGDTFLAGRNALLDRRPLPARWARPGDRASLHLRFERASLPAFDLFEPSPDWRGYSTLALDVTNPGAAPLRFTLRIHDEKHDWSNDDRLNAPIVVPPGVRTTIRVSLAAVESAPRSRRMDLSRIADVMLFSSSPAAGTELYVSRAWLE